MARYPLNLPAQLKQDAEQWAARQGVSLNQFIGWALAEKIGGLRQQLDDPAFAQITYRRGEGGWPTPVVRGTGIRVQTLMVASRDWGESTAEIAEQYGLSEAQVAEALAFYEAHRGEIEALLAEERRLAGQHAGG